MSDRFARFRRMTLLAWVPSSSAFFLSDSEWARCECQRTRALLSTLRQQGFPTQARFVRGTEQVLHTEQGVLVDVLDFFPVLLSPTAQVEASSDLSKLSAILRLALSVVSAGQAWPKLHRMGTGTRYTARWRASLSVKERETVHRLGRSMGIGVAELCTVFPSSDARWPDTSGPARAFLLLHQLVDRLVREGCRRGASVRLANTTASSFEQRLVLALGDDRALVLAPLPNDEAFSRKQEELNDWSKGALLGVHKPMLLSPCGWEADESLTQVLGRFMRQAKELSAVLEKGSAAPRMLPTGAWKSTCPIRTVATNRNGTDTLKTKTPLRLREKEQPSFRFAA